METAQLILHISLLVGLVSLNATLYFQYRWLKSVSDTVGRLEKQVALIEAKS